MFLSNNPVAPREKNVAGTSQEPRDSPQDSSFLRSKETEKKSQTSMSQETQETFVPPIHTNEEVLKRYESYRDNPNDYDGDNILINNTTYMLSPSRGLFEGSIDSARNIGSRKDPNLSQMKPTTGDFENNSNQSYLSVEGSNVISDEPEMMMPSISIDSIDLPDFFSDSAEDSQLPYDNLEGLREGSGINTACLFKNKSNIDFGSFGSIESMMNAKRDREKIQMIPTPTVNDTPQWTITKKLVKNDINPGNKSLILQESSVDEHIRRHMPAEEFKRIVTDSGIIVDVYDYDLGTMHKLRLRMGKSRNYVLTGDWVGDFVRRRSLRKNDEIGFLWDASASRLVFGVISRSTAQKKPRRKDQFQ